MHNTVKANHAVPAQKSLREWAHSLPKIDLHRHLEGSLRLTTLVEIAREHGIALPSYDIEQLRPLVQVTDDSQDYLHFLGKFQFLHRFYTSREVVQRVVREAITDAANDNIHYLELRFNPQAMANAQKFALAHVVEWVIEATEQAQNQTGTRTCLILTIPRQESLSMANEITDLAIAHFGPFIRAIDLVGDEINFPVERFIEPVKRAQEAGLHATIHAGEWAGPQSIRAAVHYLNAQRIGHGIRAVEDSDVVRLLYNRKVTLEVCPTSNIQTGAAGTFAQHPLLDLVNLQLRVTLNTDDPRVCNTTLSDEYVVAIDAMGLQKRDLYRMLRYAADAAFIPSEERGWLQTTLRQKLSTFPGALAAFDSTYEEVP